MHKPVKIHNTIMEEHLRKIAEHIVDEQRSRKDRRKKAGHDERWNEVDRQLRMEPEKSHKQDSHGRPIKGLEWLPETELPLQAQTLEMLMADTRRLKFPKNRDWFQARAALTDKYLENYSKAGGVIPGSTGQSGNEGVTQDDADRIAQAVVAHWHSAYDFRANMELIDADAFKYGYGVGRLRPVRRSILHLSAVRDASDDTIPVLVPRNARQVFLDDSQHALMHEGEFLGPNIIQCKTMKLADIKAAAQNDSSYVASECKRLAADKNGEIEVIEIEGDLVVDVGNEVIIEKNIVVTVGVGSKDGASTSAVIRTQNGEGFSTYFVSHYQQETSASAIGSSPLVKGMPIARICAQIMNRLLESGQLKNGPPIGFNRDDPTFAASGGPVIHPYALLETTDPLQVYDEVGGDPGVLFEVYQGLTSMYWDVTGVTPARLGAITKSHTTAFAKDAELARGESRTVDYVNSSLEGPMTRYLELAYRMGMKYWKKRTVYIPQWNEFAQLSRGHLPETVKFMAIGAGAPAEEQAKFQSKFDSAQAAIQLDQLGAQMGKPPKINIDALIEKILEEGGWQDVSEITVENEAEGGTVGAQGGALPGISTAAPQPLPLP